VENGASTLKHHFRREDHNTGDACLPPVRT
jgi:hypothetical protein